MRFYSILVCFVLSSASMARANGTSVELSKGDVLIPQVVLEIKCDRLNCLAAFQNGNKFDPGFLGAIDMYRPRCYLLAKTPVQIPVGYKLKFTNLHQSLQKDARTHLEISLNSTDRVFFSCHGAEAEQNKSIDRAQLIAILGSYFAFEAEPSAALANPADPIRIQIAEALAKLHALSAQLADGDPKKADIEAAISALNRAYE